MEAKIYVLTLDLELLRQQRLMLDTLLGKKTVIKALKPEELTALEGIRHGLDEIQDQGDDLPTTLLAQVNEAGLMGMVNRWTKNRRKNILALDRIRAKLLAKRQPAASE